MKTKKRIKIGIATTFVIVILMSLCGSRFVFQKACVRRETSWLNMGTADDYIYNLLVDAYNIRKEKNETVTIKASDGINLVGHYYERDKNAPLIIFFHGLWSNGYVSGEPTYKITKNQGWNLLLVSMRAHDESEGEFSTLGVIEQYDCKAWANWAVERFGEEKSVFFMGVSTGASIAMMSSNLGLPKSVRGIIDDCGFTSTMEMIDVNCKSHLPDYIPTRMFDFFVEMGTSVHNTLCDIGKELNANLTEINSNIPTEYSDAIRQLQNKDGFILQAYINSYISGDAVQNNGIDSDDFNVCQARLLEIQDYLKKAALETEEKLK